MRQALFEQQQDVGSNVRSDFKLDVGSDVESDVRLDWVSDQI